jgi:hypothetical protein
MVGVGGKGLGGVLLGLGTKESWYPWTPPGCAFGTLTFLVFAKHI